MIDQVYINLPVADVERSKTFYSGLGFLLEPNFTDETGVCFVINAHIHVMLLTMDKFKDFTPKEIADSTRTTEVLLALRAESREEVDLFLHKVALVGGSEVREPEEHGFMYGRSFEDPDGHIWEIFWMDLSKKGEVHTEAAAALLDT